MTSNHTTEPSEEEILDEISGKLALESWFEGKTLTVMVPDENGANRFAKLRLVAIRDHASAADLRGEPE